MSTLDSPVLAPPRTVTTSFWLHVAGAIIGLVGAAVELVTLPAAIDAAGAAARQVAEGRDTNGLDVGAIASGTVIGSVVLSVLLTIAFSVLTIVFARKLLQGRNWARIVLTVFAGLQLFGVIGAYGVGALHLLVLVAAVILGFLPASNAWFRAMKPVPPAL
jgi:hypothetical protein